MYTRTRPKSSQLGNMVAIFADRRFDLNKGLESKRFKSRRQLNILEVLPLIKIGTGRDKLFIFKFPYVRPR
jgi:hypothetical protein